jgi:predicted membrane-bound spermidine synthase
VLRVRCAVVTRSRPLVFSLLFLSGFTGLVYELAWSKRLSNLLGNSGQAHAIVLATFMGGLAAGAWLFGRAADRSKRPLQVYGLLELGVGLSALLFPSVLDVLGRAWLSVAPGLDGVPRTASRLVLAALALVVPTLLMGGTLPAVTRYLTERLETARRDLSLLYAVNSLGAATGCFIAGMVLVPSQGLWATERFAATLNLLLGCAALVAGRKALPPSATVAASGDEPKALVWDQAAVRAALLGTAVAGFTSMLYEITWIRVLAVVLGGTSYAFTIILTTFILGISLGSFWLSRRPDVDALRTFSRLQLSLVGAVCLALPFYERLPYAFIQLNALLQHGEQTWLLYQFITFLFCGVVLLAPTFLLGASFPAAARVAMRAVESVGSQLGTTYLANTAGTVSGSLLGGLWLLPTIGLEGNFAMGLGFNLVAAGVAGWVAKRGQSFARRLGPVLVGAVVVLGWVAGTHGWALTVASSGRFREWHRTFSSFAEFREEVRDRSDVRFYRDDVFASVLVGEQSGDRRYLRINGKVDGSNGSDIDTQVLAAHLGVLTHPREVKKVLLIGVGAGITAGSLLTHDLEQLDVVEISPAVIEAVKLFAPDTHDAFNDPRCHVYVEDARTFLTLTPERYDLIVSVPSNPWVSGVSGLFSQDFFRVARERLAPGGRVVQWIHTYESSVEMVKLVVRTLRDSFEHGTTWVGPDDLVMIASREPLALDVPTMQRRMAAPAVAADLARIRTHEVTTLLSRQLHSDADQLAFSGPGLVNTDDFNRLEYGSPIAYFVAGDVEVPDARRPPNLGRGLELEKYRVDHPATAAELRDLYASLAWVHPPNDGLVRATAERWLELDPDSLDARVAVAKAAIAQGNTAVAEALLEPVVTRGERSAAAMTPYLTAVRARLKREAAPWRPVAGCEKLEAGREASKIAGNDRDLADAISRLEVACGVTN